MIESGRVPDRIELFTQKSKGIAREIGEELGIEPWEERAVERDAWIEPEIGGLIGDQTILEFELPKGSYATVLLQEIAKKGIRK